EPWFLRPQLPRYRQSHQRKVCLSVVEPARVVHQRQPARELIQKLLIGRLDRYRRIHRFSRVVDNVRDSLTLLRHSSDVFQREKHRHHHHHKNQDIYRRPSQLSAVKKDLHQQKRGDDYSKAMETLVRHDKQVNANRNQQPPPESVPVNERQQSQPGPYLGYEKPARGLPLSEFQYILRHTWQRSKRPQPEHPKRKRYRYDNPDVTQLEVWPPRCKQVGPSQYAPMVIYRRSYPRDGHSYEGRVAYGSRAHYFFGLHRV